MELEIGVIWAMLLSRWRVGLALSPEKYSYSAEDPHPKHLPPRMLVVMVHDTTLTLSVAFSSFGINNVMTSRTEQATLFCRCHKSILSLKTSHIMWPSCSHAHSCIARKNNDFWRSFMWPAKTVEEEGLIFCAFDFFVSAPSWLGATPKKPCKYCRNSWG